MIRPEKIVLHLSFLHPIHGTFTPIKLEDHQFIDSQEEKEEALDIAKKRMEEWYRKNYAPIGELSNFVPSLHSPAAPIPIISKDIEKLEIIIENALEIRELYEVKDQCINFGLSELWTNKFNELNR